MKRLLYLFSLVVFLSQPVTAQNPNKKITVQKSFGAVNFYKDGNKLTLRQLIEVTTPCETACTEIKTAKKLYNISMVGSCIGGALLGWQTGNAISDQKVQWQMVAIGGGFLLESVTLFNQSVRKASHAVEVYNSTLQSSSFIEKHQVNVNFCLNRNGIGLQLNF